ncbi:dispanin subfamily A member 2b [Microcaecilia unicolor]|uniref:Dispanin subfamily A member 2b-like n=1 Tax=Microcaecilia unicolor TaxID=1415580 RepID=A0A6P7XQJ3_9AMPH|nr:dispanin subfamily A member 2b-like [Microcaecilia unicolor]
MDKTTFQHTAAPNTYQSPPSYQMAEVDQRALTGSGAPAGMHSSVITITPASPQPQDHIPWSVFSTLYLNTCCLGFVALLYSLKARERKDVGDMNGAIGYASTSRSLNIAALVLTMLLVILFVILFTTGIFSLRSSFIYGNGK